ncbi:MAG: UDP-N-acetylmuramate--alanine ligase [Lautropia sp.]|nr:UDP-N-acetylmuramate--alanine ligase [Lautropia sp.]
MKPILDASTLPAPGHARSELRAELAASAARMIAESALDYQSAKQKAVKRAFGGSTPPAGLMPSNEEIDLALREHLELFDPGHADRVARYRAAGRVWLERLADYHPYLCGAAWKGVVAPHTPLHIQCFTDESKELEIRLLDAGVHYDVVDIAHFSDRNADVPALIFHDRNELPVMISVYPHDDLRGALKRGQGTERGDIEALHRLMNSPANPNGGFDVPAMPSPSN